MPTVGTNPHACGDYCHYGSQDSQIWVRTYDGHWGLLAGIHNLGGRSKGETGNQCPQFEMAKEKQSDEDK